MSDVAKIGVQLRPVDTWFFRDGTPFSARSAPQEDVGAFFPPHPTTVVGAFRALLARSQGWNGRGPWPAELCTVLGDGPGNLGALAVDGPFVLRDEQPLFRAPRHLLGTVDSGKWEPRALLRPGEESVQCDLGNVRLPMLPEVGADWSNIKVGEDVWLTADGICAVLRGELPKQEAAVRSQSLWSTEPRIGLKRDAGRRTAEEGMLYSTGHVRMQSAVSLGLRVAGLPDSWRPPDRTLVPLGGESRLAECDQWDGDLAVCVRPKASCRLTLVALSPLNLGHDVYRGHRPLQLPDGLGDANVASACLGRPHRVGGWDSLARRPLPMKSVLPPGSVLFCELPEVPDTGGAFAEGLLRIGDWQEWGFGLVAVGRWPTK